MHQWLTGDLQVEHLNLSVDHFPAAWDSLRMVQLTDFHYDGLRLSDWLLTEAIAVTNAAKPDLILLTGDFVTHDPSPIYSLVQQLSKLNSRLGTYAILGNHDYYYPESAAIVTEALNSVGIQVLINQVVYPDDKKLALIGLADLFSGEFNPGSVLDTVDVNIPRIVLSHNPDTAEFLQPWRVDLQLSGHTHGGQVLFSGLGTLPELLYKAQNQLPKPLKFLIPLKSDCKKIFRHWEWSAGLHQINSNRLYTNRGLGTYLPGRWNCPPEVTIIDVQ